MTRREILKYTAGFTGMAMSASFASAFLSGCSTEPSTDYQPQFFSQEDFDFLRKCLDTLLPETDSPSATSVGVDQQLDYMLAQVYGKETKEHGQKMLKTIKVFVDQQSDMEAAFIKLEKGAAEPEVQEAYQSWKGQALAYYLSTEVIGERYLNYLPIPGAYEACISVADVNHKKWAE